MTEYVNAQTSVPKPVAIYVKQLAVVHYGSLNRMYTDVLEKFLRVRPWEANPPLEWRKAKLHGSTGSLPRVVADASWVPMNMMLPADLLDRIRATMETINHTPDGPARIVSLRTFLYTAIYWWVKYVMPPVGNSIV